MVTFFTDLTKKGYTQDEMFAVIFESEREKKRRRMQATVTETVNAHRLKKDERTPCIRETINLEEDEWFRSSCGRQGKLVSWLSFAFTYSRTTHC